MMTANVCYQLFCTDAFDWLAKQRDCAYQAVVTDPPYGVIEYKPEQLKKMQLGSGGIWRLPQSYDGHVRSPMPRFTVLNRAHKLEISLFHRRLAQQLIRVLVPGGHVILASQNLLQHLVISEFIDAGFELRGQIARIVRTLRGGDRPKGAHKLYKNLSVVPRSCWEPWAIFRKPCEGRVRDNLKKWKAGALLRPEENVPFFDLIASGRTPQMERRISPHPSLKPQAFLRQLVRAVLPFRDGIVLDPFMGGGSTIAAAESLQYSAIGLEVSHEYFDLARAAIPRLAELG